MQRIVEPELMLDKQQVLAFSRSNKYYGIKGFLEFYEKYINLTSGTIVDLGSGPGQYLLALEEKYPNLLITGYDGSDSMVEIAQAEIEHLSSAIKIRQGLIENINDKADCVISANTLHHLHDPTIFWNCIKRTSNRCLVFDLIRPETIEQAATIVNFYASDEDELFKKDYFNSLLAAFSIEELYEQIKGTNLKIETVQGKHDFAKCCVIHGYL